MNRSANLPHIYYTIGELSLVKNAKKLKNVNVKTLAYIKENFAHGLEFKSNGYERSDRFVELDLTYIYHTCDEMKPYLIFGIFYTWNHSAHIFVKAVKQLNLDVESVIIYHHQLLALRKRSPHFEHLNNQALEIETITID